MRWWYRYLYFLGNRFFGINLLLLNSSSWLIVLNEVKVDEDEKGEVYKLANICMRWSNHRLDLSLPSLHFTSTPINRIILMPTLYNGVIDQPIPCLHGEIHLLPASWWCNDSPFHFSFHPLNTSPSGWPIKRFCELSNVLESANYLWNVLLPPEDPQINYHLSRWTSFW